MISTILTILFWAAFIYSFIHVSKIKKNYSEQDSSLSSDDLRNAKIAILFSPIFASTVYYYGLRKKLLTAAKTLNKWSWIVILLWIILYAASAYWIWNYSDNPEVQQVRNEMTEIQNEFKEKSAESDSEINALMLLSDLMDVRIKAELFFANNSSYVGVCDLPEVSEALTKLDQSKCLESADSYAIAGTIPGSSVKSGPYCIDAAGYNAAGEIDGSNMSCIAL